MGYCIDQINSSFHMKADGLEAAANAVRAAWNGKKQIGWIKEYELNESDSLTDLADTCRWDMEQNMETLDIESIYFNGEKYGDDLEAFLGAIAPYVEAGSYIEFSGEEGERFRFLFKDGKVKEQQAEVTYED